MGFIILSKIIYQSIAFLKENDIDKNIIKIIVHLY